MNKKAFLWIIALTLLVANAHAVTDNDLFPFLEAYYKFGSEGSDGGIVIDYSPAQRYNLSSWDTGNGITNDSASCLLDDCFEFSGGGAFHGTLPQYASGSEFTLCYWHDSDLIIRTTPWQWHKDGNNTNHLTADNGNTNTKVQWYWSQSASNRRIIDGGTGSFGAGSWQLNCGIFNDVTDFSSNFDNFTNSTNLVTQTLPIAISGMNILNFGDSKNGLGAAFNGHLDDWYYFNKSLSPEEITYLYNSGAGRILSASPPATNITITLNQPSDNDVNDTTNLVFKYNVTSELADLTSCSLFLNSTGTWTANTTNTTPTNNSQNNFDLGNIGDGIYKWNVYCNDTAGSFESAPNNFTLTIDTIEPEITTSGALFNGNYHVSSNGILNGNPFIQGWANSTDSNLYSFNVSILGIKTLYNITGITSGSASYFINENVSYLGPGSYVLQVRAADGHTARDIKDYDYREGLNSLTFDFKNNDVAFFEKDYVLINVDGISGELKAEKGTDRYAFEYTRLLNLDSITLFVESDHAIEIVENSEYDGHLVISGLDKWVDFEIPESLKTRDYEITTTRIGRNEIRIDLSGIVPTRTLPFNSIGDLNINTVNTSFTIINATNTYHTPVIDTTQTRFTLNFTANQSYDTSALLNYQGVYYTPTETSSSTWQAHEVTLTIPATNTSSNNSINWNYTIIGPSNTEMNITNNFTQEVTSFLIELCGSGYTAANFTIYDEVDLSPLNGSVDASLNAKIIGSTTSKDFGFSLTGSQQYSLCVTPTDIILNVTTNALTYTAPGYVIRNAEFQNNIWTNLTTNYDLYLLADNTSTGVIIEVKDLNDEEVTDAIIRVNRFFPSNNTFVTVETALTDFTGKTQVQLILDDVFYSFTIEKDGNILREVPASRIYSTSLLFIVDLGQSLPGFEDKVFWSIAPESPVSPVPTNFSFTVVPLTGYNVDWFAIESYFNNTKILTNSTSSTGGTVMATVPLNQSGYLVNKYYIKLQGEDLFILNQTYVVSNLPGNHSFLSLSGDIKDNFPLWFLTIVAVCLSLVGAILVGIFGGTTGGGIAALIIQLFFAIPIIGWIPFNVFIIESFLIIGLYLIFSQGEL